MGELSILICGGEMGLRPREGNCTAAKTTAPPTTAGQRPNINLEKCFITLLQMPALFVIRTIQPHLKLYRLRVKFLTNTSFVKACRETPTQYFQHPALASRSAASGRVGTRKFDRLRRLLSDDAEGIS